MDFPTNKEERSFGGTWIMTLEEEKKQQLKFYYLYVTDLFLQADNRNAMNYNYRNLQRVKFELYKLGIV